MRLTIYNENETNTPLSSILIYGVKHSAGVQCGRDSGRLVVATSRGRNSWCSIFNYHIDFTSSPSCRGLVLFPHFHPVHLLSLRDWGDFCIANSCLDKINSQIKLMPAHEHHCMFSYSVVFIIVPCKSFSFIKFNVFADFARLWIDLQKANLALRSPSKLGTQIRQILVRCTALQTKCALRT